MSILVDGVYRHRKRGTTYVVLGLAKMQIGAKSLALPSYPTSIAVAKDLECRSFVVYRCREDDTLWIRPESEFLDGRFDLVPRRTGYVLRRYVDGAVLYYKNGADHGWVTNKKEATLYSEEDFALRDKANALSLHDRRKTEIMRVDEEN